MNIIKTKLDGVYVIEPKVFEDNRGLFVKTFNLDFFRQNGLETSFNESYYSISNKNVIRGMHFQTPPADHTKLVYVTHGEVDDVVLDIRKYSKTYGEFVKINLSDETRRIVYIPSGFAHGFRSLKDDTCVVYMQSSVYSKENDFGIRVDSFGMDWGPNLPIMSERDKCFPGFGEFDSPFI